ncbi:MAG: hypothetical protein K2J76_02550, partial [Oscillospiraceae bacterium]|nr:hypothetical protein [Oscillospiraceae bacterium]
MCKQIDEIMQLSDNGYIEEYDDIEVILEHFLNYSIEELNNALPQNHKILDFAAEIAIKLGNIDITNTSQLEKITLSDLLCIMKYSEKTRYESEEAIFSYMKYLRNSIAYLKGLPWATLFMSISV